MIQSFRRIKIGFCNCGCGKRTKLAPQTQNSKGWIKGKPLQFLKGHRIPKTRIYFNCINCQKEEWYTPSQTRVKDIGKFCTRKCWSEHHNANPTMNKSMDSAGYERIAIAGKMVKIHRYLMSKKLGRELTQKEHVHHKNGIKNDNRVENLEIVTQSDHLKEHWKDESFRSRIIPTLLKNTEKRKMEARCRNRSEKSV